MKCSVGKAHVLKNLYKFLRKDRVYCNKIYLSLTHARAREKERENAHTQLTP